MHHFHHRLSVLSIAFAVLVAVASTATAAQTITTVATSNALGGLGLSIPSLNNNGTVVFVNTSPGTNGLYTGTGGPLTTVVTSQNYFRGYAPAPGRSTAPLRPSTMPAPWRFGPIQAPAADHSSTISASSPVSRGI